MADKVIVSVQSIYLLLKIIIWSKGFETYVFHNIFSSLCHVLFQLLFSILFFEQAMCTKWNFNESSLFEPLLFQLPFFNT